MPHNYVVFDRIGGQKNDCICFVYCELMCFDDAKIGELVN